MISADLLKTLPIFKDCSKDTLKSLSADMEDKTFESGEVIIKEGEKSGSLFFIVHGFVSIEKAVKKQEKNTKVVARLEAGEFFGEMSFLENQPHSANVISRDKTRVYTLPRKSLDNLIKKDPKTALENSITLFAGVSGRLRRTTRELVTVFEISRLIGHPFVVQDLMEKIVDQILSAMDGPVSAGFYLWNPFNDEYSRVAVRGGKPDEFPEIIEPGDSLLEGCGIGGQVVKGNRVISRSDMQDSQQGLFIYAASPKASFGPGEKQMMETVSAMLAPALATARVREEEEARRRLDQSRQQGFTL